MPLVINSNIPSLNSQRQLVKSGDAVNTAMERLSSGQRINSAADDAAGMAISNRQTAQIRGLDQAVRNANDGISLIQTAEGALSETSNILQRMRELAVQSANGIYGDGDRATLDAEVKQLVSELDRISSSTSFNGQNILDGSLGKLALQVGANANQTIDLQIQAMDAKTLGMGSQSVDMMGSEMDLTNGFSFAANDILINGQSILKGSETFDTSTDNFEDLVGYINDNVNGVTASTYAQVTAESVGDGILTGANTVDFTVTKLDGTTTAISVGHTQSLEELADKINSESGGLLNASIGENGRISISGSNVESIAVAGTTTALGTSLTGGDGQLILTSDHGDPITIERGATGTLDDLTSLGFRENNEQGTIEGNIAGSAALGVGDLKINGTSIAATDDGELQTKIDAINAVQSETGVSAQAFSTATMSFAGVDVSALAGDITINGAAVELTDIATNDIDLVVSAINDAAATSGVTASLLGDKIVLEGNVSSINFASAVSTSTLAADLTDGTTAATIDDAAGATVALTTATASADGGIKLTSSNGNPISVEVTTTGATNTGLLDANATAGGSFGTAISSISISTAAGAQKAIDVIDNALDTVNDVRSGLGATSNRLDFTVSNLMNVSENTQAARSRIMDADFAAETASLSRAQVLQQASQAMLAQANAKPQQVLSLLQ